MTRTTRLREIVLLKTFPEGVEGWGFPDLDKALPTAVPKEKRRRRVVPPFEVAAHAVSEMAARSNQMEAGTAKTTTSPLGEGLARREPCASNDA